MRLTIELPAQLPWRLLAAILVAAAATLSVVQTLDKPDYGDLDFGAYYRAAGRVAAGQTPYQIDEYGPLGSYPYAPAYACLLTPLAALDYLPAARLWLLLNWTALGLALLLAWRLVHGTERVDWLVLLLTAVPLAMYCWANLRVGQVALFMIVACLAWAYARRQGWPLLGGLALAAACALKLAPGLLVLWLLGRRDWRGLAGVALGAAVLAVLPACWFGGDGAVRLHQEWLTQVRETQVVEQTIRPGNQSLLALLARLPAVSNGHVCSSEDNLAWLSRWYPLLVAGLASAAVLLCCWRSPSGRAEGRKPPGTFEYPGAYAPRLADRETLQLALLFILLTLLHPRAWRCNFMALLLPCLLLATHLRHQRPGWRVALAALLLLPLVCALPTGGVGQDGWSVAAWLLQAKHFWAAVAVGVACVWCHGRHTTGASASARAADRRAA